MDGLSLIIGFFAGYLFAFGMVLLHARIMRNLLHRVEKRLSEVFKAKGW